MNRPGAAPAQGEDVTIDQVVNSAVDERAGNTDVASLAAAVEQRAKEMEASETVRRQASTYASRIKEVASGQTVNKLGGDVAGLYTGPGKIQQDMKNFKLNGSDPTAIGATVSNVEFVGRHEKTHQEHNDHLALRTVQEPGDRSGTAVRMGNVNLTQTELQEGANLLVNGTGSDGGFESSAEYHGHLAKLKQGMSAAGVSKQQLVTALTAREAFALDDRVREPQFAMAA